MDIGVIMFPTDKAIQPMELARACEERGFESLWFPEHSHIPPSRETPWGGNPNLGPLPEEYWRTHDQFVALTAAAAVTQAAPGNGHHPGCSARSNLACQGSRQPRHDLGWAL